MAESLDALVDLIILKGVQS